MHSKFKGHGNSILINVVIDEYQEIEDELPFDGTAELWWDWVEDMQADFDSPEAETAVADADDITAKLTCCENFH